MKLQQFLDAHQPLQTTVASDGVLETYEQTLPDALLEVWREVGFGLYGDGLIQLVDPGHYQQNLWGWLLREEEDLSRLPIALSAFGHIFYYRRLSDEGDEDVCYIDPHTSQSGVLIWSLEAFFNETLCDQESIAELLEPMAFSAARTKAGPLTAGEIYAYAPALRLGGSKSVEGVVRCDAQVQLDLLLQLALG
jgi:hypothetical protein